MKKFTISLLILLCLSFNIITLIPLAITNTFKEGFYKASDFHNLSTNNYTVENVSSTDIVYVFVFDKDEDLYNYMKLKPNSPKYELLSIDPDFKIVIVGKGEVFISPKAT